MSYLLDTNTLIQAKNEYYAFDLCPGFWKWLERNNEGGMVHSIEPVCSLCSHLSNAQERESTLRLGKVTTH